MIFSGLETFHHHPFHLSLLVQAALLSAAFQAFADEELVVHKESHTLFVRIFSTPELVEAFQAIPKAQTMLQATLDTSLGPQTHVLAMRTVDTLLQAAKGSMAGFHFAVDMGVLDFLLQHSVGNHDDILFAMTTLELLQEVFLSFSLPSTSITRVLLVTVRALRGE